MIVSDTGPLISAFQSRSFPLLHALIGHVVVPHAVADEITQHGWSDELAAAGERIRVVELETGEHAKAQEVADAIGTSDPLPHRGEAEAIVLACRSSEFRNSEFCELILIDELAARNYATKMGLRVVGFPGILLMATRTKVLSPEDLKSRLESCRDQGTYYSQPLIEDVYQMAHTVWRSP